MNSNSNLKDTNRNNCVNKINSILDDIPTNLPALNKSCNI